jgi:hypothetical protein
MLITLLEKTRSIIVKLLHYGTTPLGILKNDIKNIGKLESTELISTSLPPDKRSLPFQLLSFF